MAPGIFFGNREKSNGRNFSNRNGQRHCSQLHCCKNNSGFDMVIFDLYLLVLVLTAAIIRLLAFFHAAIATLLFFALPKI